jgi:hypothetical protein
LENWALRDSVKGSRSSSPLSEPQQSSAAAEAVVELQHDEVPAAVMLEILGLEQLAPAA